MKASKAKNVMLKVTPSAISYVSFNSNLIVNPFDQDPGLQIRVLMENYFLYIHPKHVAKHMFKLMGKKIITILGL